MDEQVVQELCEGQDMTVEFSKTATEASRRVKLGEPDNGDAMFSSNELITMDPLFPDALEMWLNY